MHVSNNHLIKIGLSDPNSPRNSEKFREIWHGFVAIRSGYTNTCGRAKMGLQSLGWDGITMDMGLHVTFWMALLPQMANVLSLFAWHSHDGLLESILKS